MPAEKACHVLRRCKEKGHLSVPVCLSLATVNIKTHDFKTKFHKFAIYLHVLVKNFTVIILTKY